MEPFEVGEREAALGMTSHSSLNAFGSVFPLTPSVSNLPVLPPN